MGAREFTRGRRVVARLPFGGDLLAEIAAVADGNGILMAELRGIGALQGGRLAFYDQAAREYAEFDLDGPVEIASLLGTVTRRDGATAVHAHATLSGHDGACFGGHLVAGCTIFACELALQELVGEPLEREYDEQTGLPLWRGL
jgi:predicted DNA-binding protein with PD1-like motif